MPSNHLPHKVHCGQLIGQHGNRSKEGRTNISKITSRPPWRNAFSQLEAFAADRDTWRWTCENSLATFLTASDQAAEDHHTRRHATSDPSASGPCCLTCNRTVSPSLDFRVISTVTHDLKFIAQHDHRLWWTTASNNWTTHRANTNTRWHFAFRLCCHSNETHAPIANLPNCAQLEGTPYHSPKLQPGPCSSVGMWQGTDRQTHRCMWPIYILHNLRLTRNVIAQYFCLLM